jgi:glutathione reductase (NADPH)
VTVAFDLFVLGGGSAGVRLARTAASLGAKVALCEDAALGGTCVNVGCVPKKLYGYGASYAEGFEDAAGYGWHVDAPAPDWAHMVARKDKEIARLNGIYERLLSHTGVTLIRGRGVVKGPSQVEVAGQTYNTTNTAICTGGRPWMPEHPPNQRVMVSDDLFALKELPKRLVCVGGGYIAVEFASIFHGYGVEVDLVHRGDMILRGFDQEVREHLAEELVARGIRLHFNALVDFVAEDRTVHLKGGQQIPTDAVLMAIGRRPNSHGIGLDEVGVERNDRGAILVDEGLRTSVPSIYALGDVIERIQLTPMALSEGTWLAHRLFGQGDKVLDYNHVATAVFTNPTVSTVGFTEEDALAAGLPIAVYTSRFRPLKHTMSGRNTHMFMKLIVHSESDKVLGAHMIGEGAAEIMQGLAIALKCGATKAQFDATIGIHPTAAEEFVTMRTPRG